jgi:FG-GAP-like repeat
VDALGGTRVRAIAILAFALLGGGAQAATQTIVGIDSLHFAWAPASGNPRDYLVVVSRNGSALTGYKWVNEPSVDIPVAPYERVAVAVLARRLTSSGSYAYSPLSPLSDEILVLPSPVFPVQGQWTLYCATCGLLSVRSLADASVVEREGPALTAPWNIVGDARVGAGEPALVWHNAQYDGVQLWDRRDLWLIPGASMTVQHGAFWVGSADVDHDGVEELFFHDEKANRVDVMTFTGARLELRATRTGAAGSSLVAVGEFNGDGRIDLIWHEASTGSVRMWSVPDSLTRIDQLPSVLPAGDYLIFGYYRDARIVEVADFDADGRADLLWRLADGAIHITYQDAAGYRPITLATDPGDPYCDVVGVVDIDGVPGLEIALQDRRNGEIKIAFPRMWTYPLRKRVASPGAKWKVVDVGRRAAS